MHHLNSAVETSCDAISEQMCRKYAIFQNGGGGAYELFCSHPLGGSLIAFDINGLRINDFL